VSIWLVGDPDPARRLPEEMTELADRIIVDSANGAVPGLAMKALAASAHLGPDIEDLAWYRSAVWRELVAQFFDADAAAAELTRLTRIEIAGGAGSISTAALLTGGWLAAQLGLNIASVDAGSTMTRATYYAGADAVELHIAPSHGGTELDLVSIQTENATFSVQRHQAGAHLAVIAEFAAQPAERTVSPGFTHDAAMLALALDRTGADEVFARALEASLQLSGD
jgi:glucose-6-phosphate dehydrogenase assembly protein OpcA